MFFVFAKWTSCYGRIWLFPDVDRYCLVSDRGIERLAGGSTYIIASIQKLPCDGTSCANDRDESCHNRNDLFGVVKIEFEHVIAFHFYRYFGRHFNGATESINDRFTRETCCRNEIL